MSIVSSYEPFYDIDRFLEEALSPLEFSQRQLAMQSNMNMANRQSQSGAMRMFRPRMDLHEDSAKNQVTAMFELPGASKEDIKLELQNGKLVVSAEIKTSNNRDEGGYVVCERRFGRFSRTLQVSPGVKDQDIKASMKNGVLTVTFPKSTPEAAARKIPIMAN